MIELVFFTSSRVKLAHAAYLCRDYDVTIIGFREKTFRATYIEPRISDREQLIDLSYRDALERWERVMSGEKLFFIEDTSVTISALSAEREVPGLDVKYWMAEMNFEKLDGQLREHGNDRRAAVRSDVILHLPRDLQEPGKKSYKQFTSVTMGYVVERDEAFDTNPTYPWLDNSTFNRWFSPAPSSRSISTLPIGEADRYDFRARAFQQMLEYLESHKKVTRKSRSEVQATFGFGPRLFIVCGPSCAGKTTLAEYLGERYGYCHIEASDFMYRAYYRRHGTNSTVNITDFAAQALREEPEIVARQILENISTNARTPIVITGYRSWSEIDWFMRNYDGECSVEMLYVTATQAVRYVRSVKRGREDEANGYDEFVNRDSQQENMGLSDLEARFADDALGNNASLEEYFAEFERRYSPELQTSLTEAMYQRASSTRLEDAILLALARASDRSEYHTTTEIAQLINSFEDQSPKSKNNISRFFNQLFYPYFEIKVVNGKRKYRLSNTGRGRVRLLTKARDRVAISS